MPTTRSASKKQTRLDEYKDDNTRELKSAPKKQATTKTKAASKPAPNSSAKRKAPTDDHVKSSEPKSKKSKKDQAEVKQAHFVGDGTTDLEKPIIINRSPVLQLWGASVAQFLHPDESWETCLSIGGSIASLCAISKGRSIGKVEPKNESTGAEDKRRKRKQETEQETEEIEVMGFPMHIKDGVVIADGKPKPLKEGTLTGKFGGEDQYAAAKAAMHEALQSWKGDEDELDKKAFHMYEKFRPDVSSGQSGWGKKGELNLHEVKNVIGK